MQSGILAAALLFGGQSAVQAQPPTALAEGRGVPGADALLSRTGELGLNDQQVLRLAAIARREAARRQAIRASLDSVRRAFAAGDTAARRTLAQRTRQGMESAREAARTDRREALAVLNADQQARAWELFAGRRPGARGMRPFGPRMRGMGMRGMPGPGRQRASSMPLIR
jgi:hypothetical protein